MNFKEILKSLLALVKFPLLYLNKSWKLSLGSAQRGGVHSSRIKCKGVQVTQKNWQEIANFLKNVEEHPHREQKYWMLSYIF